MDHKKDVSQHSGSPLHKAEIEWVLYYGKTRIIAAERFLSHDASELGTHFWMYIVYL